MNRAYLKFSASIVAASLLIPTIIFGQKEEKNKEKTEKKDVEQIIITRKGNSTDKITVEINNDKITVNGKPIQDLKDGDITVNVHKMKDGWNRSFNNDNWNMNWNNGNNFIFSENENTPMLGVETEETKEGVKITDVTEESGASKAGLKEDDIITKIDDKKISNPDELTKVIRSHKPGEKISITYLRENKEQKTTAELGKWKGAGVFNLNTPNMDWDMIKPKVHVIPRAITPDLHFYTYQTGHPKLGLSVQDTEDGKGVKVIDVDEEGNAQKAGVKKDDIITGVNDKEVNSADEVLKIVRDSREKNSIMLKISRGGKIQNIEVKIPRKLKTADL
jgi:serine protease Do